MQKLIHIEKAAKKAKIPTDMAKQIILVDHELNNLIPKKNLKKIQIGGEDGISLKTLNELNKIAKDLNVSVDAVIGTMLIKYLESKK